MTMDLLAFGKWMQHNIAVDCCWRSLAVGVGGLPVLDHRAGPRLYGRVPDRAAGVRQDLAEVPGGAVSRTLSTLLTGGLPLVPSLETAARSISSRRVSKAVMQSIVTVREGKSLADALTKTKVFPDLAAEMITVGEQTGALPQMLNSVAEFFEEDVATALTAALALIEPAILIVMGMVVVFILISLYLPIFSLGQAGGGQG